MTSKTYFIIPSLVYRPDDYIQLGQVITDPLKPYDRLATPLPLTGKLEPRVSTSKNWSFTKTENEDAAIGLFAHIMDIVSAEASGSRMGSDSLSRGAAVVETQYFEISEDKSYADLTSAVPAVKEEIKKLRSVGKTVYMITGIKIAKWPKKATQGSSAAVAVTGKLEGKVDPQGLVSLGANAHDKSSNSQKVSETPTTAYVVAYRLRKLRVSWSHKLKVGDEMDGADMHGIGGKTTIPDITENKDSEADWEVSSVSVVSNDFGASLPPKYKKLKAVDEDDGRTCTVIRAVV